MYDAKDDSFDKDSIQTPFYLWNWLNSLYSFDVDLAASKKHHLAEYYYDLDNSALEDTSIWWQKGRRGFCNPPYSDISPWVDKAITMAGQGFTTVMLIPTPNGETYYQPLLDNCTLLIQIIGRISFVHPGTGEWYKGNNRGSCVVEFRQKFFNHGHHQISVTRDDIYNQFQRKNDMLLRKLAIKDNPKLRKLLSK